MSGHLDFGHTAATASDRRLEAGIHPMFQPLGGVAVHDRLFAEGHAADRADADGVFNPAAVDMAGDAANRFALNGKIAADCALFAGLSYDASFLGDLARAEKRTQRFEKPAASCAAGLGFRSR